jgi:hypothetical protein
MNSVSLISTVHDERGFANAAELHAILVRIRPDVIFLEVPPAAFNDYYRICSRKNLESIAVKQYQEGHKVDLVPVDLPTPGEEFFSNSPDLFKRIEEESREFCRLIDANRIYAQTYGFAYLNSEHSTKLWSDVYEEMQGTIGKIGDARLVELYESWKEVNDLREKEMMEKIQKYCGENTFEKGVFLLGVAHRQRVIDKSREQSAVAWDFPG